MKTPPALSEVDGLMSQFLDLLIDAGFVTSASTTSRNQNASNALFLQCVLVSGLYPNVAILRRPKVTGRGGSLLTKSNEKAKPHNHSFQWKRVREAGATGKDAYATYHSKHRSVGVGGSGSVTLSQVRDIGSARWRTR